MNKIELQAKQEVFRKELKILDAIVVKCGSCEEWRGQRCEKYGMAPPPEVVAVGCESWSYDFIPF